MYIYICTFCIYILADDHDFIAIWNFNELTGIIPLVDLFSDTRNDDDVPSCEILINSSISKRDVPTIASALVQLTPWVYLLEFNQDEIKRTGQV